LLFQSEQSKAFAYLNQSLKIREENKMTGVWLEVIITFRILQ
jgi:hypothetical protein